MPPLIAPLLLAAAQATPAYELISIDRVPIADGDYVDAFAIDTFGVETVAVCRVPNGWAIGIDADGTPLATLHGQSGHGASAISNNNNNWNELASLFLVRRVTRDWPVDAAHPPSFTLKLMLNSYGTGSDADRVVQVPERYVTRTPAAACPAPAD